MTYSTYVNFYSLLLHQSLEKLPFIPNLRFLHFCSKTGNKVQLHVRRAIRDNLIMAMHSNDHMNNIAYVKHTVHMRCNKPHIICNYLVNSGTPVLPIFVVFIISRAIRYGYLLIFNRHAPNTCNFVVLSTRVENQTFNLH